MTAPLPKFVARSLPKARRPTLRIGLIMLALISGRRVIGLAAEAAFWALFSLPWILIALITGVGWVGEVTGTDSVSAVQGFMSEAIARIFTPETAEQYLNPIVGQMFARTDLSVVGIVLALWSGSKAFTTFAQAIEVINGELGDRGYLVRRVIGLVQYTASVGLVAIALPVMVLGPARLSDASGLPAWAISALTIVFSAVVLLAVVWGMFHFAAVKRAGWASELPGAALAVVGTIIVGYGITFYVDRLVHGNTVIGMLVAPIAVMVFVYGFCLVALLGATFNAASGERAPFAFRQSGSPVG